MEKAAALIARYPRWLALLSGGISATGFAPLNLWPLTLLSLALLMHLVASAQSGKRAFLIGWLFGVGHFSVGNNWIATAFTFQSAMPEWLGWIAVVLLALYLAAYPALACSGAWLVGNKAIVVRGLSPHGDCPFRAEPEGQSPCGDSPQVKPSLPFILAFAGFWIVTEWLRSWVFTGFAWNPLGVIAVSFQWPTIWIGTYGLSGLIILACGFPFWWDKALSSKPIAHKQLVGIAIVITAIAAVKLSTEQSPAQLSKTNLTIAQPNVSQIDKHTVGYEAINFSRLAQNSRVSGDGARILVWPESAIPWWLEDGYPPQAYINQPGGSAAATRATLANLLGPADLLLTGGDRLEFGADGRVAGARNSALALNAKGEILATYDKAHLVPYGEYLALRWLLEPLGVTRLVPGAFDFWPGPGPRTLDLPFDGKRVKVGVQICYEIIFSGQVVDRTNRPDFIFNPSNEAWYGPWASPQFVAMARLRAIEEGLPVVRATPTGISAVIDADGRITDALPSGKPGRIDAFLPVAKAPTLFARYGNILPLVFAALLIAAAFLPLVRRRISR